MTDAREIRSLNDRSFFYSRLIRSNMCDVYYAYVANNKRNSRHIMRSGYFKRGRTRCVDTMISQISNGVGLIFHIRRLMANFRKLLGSSQKFFKAHPTNLSYDAWNIRPWHSWKSYIHQYLGTRTPIMLFQNAGERKWSFRLKTAKLVSLSQSRRVGPTIPKPQNRIGWFLSHKMISFVLLPKY